MEAVGRETDQGVGLNMSSSKKTAAKVFDGKRKTAMAQAFIKPGSGRVSINGVPIEILNPEIARLRIIQTLLLAQETAKKFDIEVKVRGGGYMGQAEAASIAIAKALTGMTRGKKLEKIYKELDRTLLAGDSRRTEPKKFGGPGSRRRKQKSYR